MSNSRHNRVALAGLLVGLAACGGFRMGAAPVPSSPARADIDPRNGLEVIGAMRRAHPSRELRSMSFTVNTVEYREDESSHHVLARAFAALPGKYRQTNLPSSRRSGFVRNQQRLSVFERGRRVTSRNRVDLAMLLAYDVFAQGVDSTIKWLDVANVRFGIARKDRLDGRSVWVVGAFEGDTMSTQFWVDAYRWRVLRVIQHDPRSPNRIVDVRFSEFTQLLDVPVPTRIRVYHGGRLVQHQEISNFATNPSLPSRAFDLSRWREVRIGD